jgi:hypothetical protein
MRARVSSVGTSTPPGGWIHRARAAACPRAGRGSTDRCVGGEERGRGARRNERWEGRGRWGNRGGEADVWTHEQVVGIKEKYEVRLMRGN